MPSRRDFLKGALAAATIIAAAGLFEYIYTQKHETPSSVPSSSTQTEQVTTTQLTNDAFAIGTKPVLVSVAKLANDAFAIQVKPMSRVQLLTNDAFAIMEKPLAA